MNMRTLIDTDILIDVGRGQSEALTCLMNIQANSSLAISIVTQMELVVGCRDKTELRDLKKFLKPFQIVKIDEAVCDRALGLLEKYRLSHGLLIADALIAATALESQSPFISKNQRDYQFIKSLKLLPYPVS